MKSRILTCITAITLFAALAMPVQLAAQEDAGQVRKPKHHHYKLIDIGTFGGPNSFFNDLSLSDRFGLAVPAGFAQVLNTQGVLVGWADTSTPDPNVNFCLIPGFDCFVAHAFKWRNGVKADLGTLPSGVSSGAFWINAPGLIAGFSQNGEIDPLSGLPELRAVVWANDQIIDLGTLGGNTSFAAAVNNRGQVAGAAQNAIPDPFSFQYQFCCQSSNGTQSRAFLWDREEGMQDLGTLGGHDAAPGPVNQPVA